MDVVSDHLDFPVDAISGDLCDEFEHKPNYGECFLYVTEATNLKWSGGRKFYGTVTLTKFRKVPVRFWHLRRKRRGWKRVWSFSEQGYMTDSCQGIIRTKLFEAAVNHGVMVTKILLDKSLCAIERKLYEHCNRICELTRAESSRSNAA